MILTRFLPTRKSRQMTFKVEIQTTLSEQSYDQRFHEMKALVATPTVASVENHLAIEPQVTKSRMRNAIYHFVVTNKPEKGEKAETKDESIREFLEHFVSSLGQSRLVNKVTSISFIFDDESKSTFVIEDETFKQEHN